MAASQSIVTLAKRPACMMELDGIGKALMKCRGACKNPNIYSKLYYHHIPEELKSDYKKC